MISNMKDYNILEKPEGENSCDDNILLTPVGTKLPKNIQKAHTQGLFDWC